MDQKQDLLKFRNECKEKQWDFYVANNLNLSTHLNSDGIYLSSYNKSFKALSLKKSNFRIIGSAHSQKEIYMKIKQGCEFIIFSKLFLVNYNLKAPFYGTTKFSNLLNNNENLIP